MVEPGESRRETTQNYNHGLIMTISWNWILFLSEVVNSKIIPLEKAPEAYHAFDADSLKKFIIDTQGSVKKAA
jgi:glutathione-independent formaldehyde dehydrogenase